MKRENAPHVSRLFTFAQLSLSPGSVMFQFSVQEMHKDPAT